MTDQTQLFLFGQTAPGNNDAALFGRMQECATSRNRNGGGPGTKALEGIPASNIQQMAVGPSHIAFLFKDSRIARLSFDIIQTKVESPSSISVEKSTSASTSHGVTDAGDGSSASAPANTSQPPSQAAASSSSSTSATAASYAAAASAAANRTQKIRRVMMAARRPGTFCSRTGVVDRARQMVPASSIPEELIAQAQVVLQGKSRETIVRELQRTNLNVNEAVNNLLSRDDDEGDELDETSEAYLHEELLSLLDAGLRSDGSGTALIDPDNIYTSAEGYEYLVTRDLARRRDESKTKERSGTKESGSENNGTTIQDQLVLGNTLEYWGGVDESESPFPPGVNKFVKITSMHSELIALADDGKLYGWSWEKKAKPASAPHRAGVKLLGAKEMSDADATSGEIEERIIDMESCAWRTVVMTNLMRVGSFVDGICGTKIFNAFFDALLDVPNGESVEKLHVCPLFSAVQTTNNYVFWRGVYPFNERRKLYEKSKSKMKKHVTFDTSEVTVGCEVRTKSSPIYAAGSVAINFSGGVPLIGTLMESAWTLNETCRFRVQSLEQFEQQAGEKQSQQSERKVSFNIAVRKRCAATSDEAKSASAHAAVKETAWALKDVIFIQEESIDDVATVKIVDGAYCGVVYNRNNGDASDDGELSKVRLMRKDDLVVINPAYCASRSPENFQRNFLQVHLPSSARRIIAMACDVNGFRILIEKRNCVHLIRMSCLTKLLSDHQLPLHLNAINKALKCRKGKPSLDNYGDDSTLVLRDAAGNLVPLVRNAVNGFKEPAYIGMGPLHDMSIGIRYLKSADELSSPVVSFPAPNSTVGGKGSSANKSANRLILIAALVAAPSPAESTSLSLMRSILFCDLEGVSSALEQLQNASEDVQQMAIAGSKVDGNRNIFHAAVMYSFATTNRDQGDIDSDELFKSRSLDLSEADSAKARYDRRWAEMIGGASPSKSDRKSGKMESSVELRKKNTEMSGGGVPSPKERQANAIQIVREMVKSPIVGKYFLELMREKDINGHTPFMSAIEHRAYSAGMFLWRAIVETASVGSQSPANQDQLTELAMPAGSRPDDAPLYVLCANDNCSFTWTGEVSASEHINQDIFECKTCGLTGTLCCCTECAFTCHKNHDCKLKRTSPTAYCDCWEKSECRSLVTGNTFQREKLLLELLNKTNLIGCLNSRNEHLLLFLARTVARQLVEQDNPIARSGRVRHKAGHHHVDTKTPEHDLEPPRFALKAFDIGLRSWFGVKSLLQVGIKKVDEESVMVEDIFHLAEQHGSTHLDKFLFTLLARCQESHLDTFLNTLIAEANREEDAGRDAEVDVLISRVVRSAIRLLTLMCAMSTAATSLLSEFHANSMTAPSKQYSTSVSNSSTGSVTSKSTHATYRAVAISGVLSLVSGRLPISTSSLPLKESKAKKTLNNFILRTRRLFQALISYSIVELLNVSDALIAPVRLGVVKPMSINSLSGNDVIDAVEKCLTGETDLTTLLASANDGSAGASNTTAVSAKKEAQRDEDDSMHSNLHPAPVESEPESDSDNDEQPTRQSISSGGVSHVRSEERGGATLSGASSRRRQSQSRRRYNLRRLGSAEEEEEEDSTDSYTSASEGDDAMGNEVDEGEDSTRAGRERRHSDRSHSPEHSSAPADEGMNEEGGEDEGDDAHDDEEDDEDEHEIEDEDEDDEEEDTYGFNPDDDYIDADDGAVHLEEYSSESEGESPAQRRSSRRQRSAPLAEPEGESSSTNAASKQDLKFKSRLEVEPEGGNRRTDEQETDREPDEERMEVGESHPVIESGGNAESTAVGDSSLPAAHRSARSVPLLSWAVSRVRSGDSVEGRGHESQTVDDSDQSRSENRANAAVESAAIVSATAVGSTGDQTTRQRHKDATAAVVGDDANYGAAVCLSMSFAVVVTLIDELLLQLRNHEEWKRAKHSGITALLKVDPNFFDAFMRSYEERMEPTWAWLNVVMDRTEAQLKFGNALIASPAGSYLQSMADVGGRHAPVEGERKPDSGEARRGSRRKTDPKRGDDVSHPPSSARYELFSSYILSLMRSHSAENGDDLPIIEYNTLKAVTLVCEAYLAHIDVLDQLYPGVELKDSAEEMELYEAMVKEGDLRRFFKRSKSICYPLISAAEPHHAFKYAAGECLPLATRTHLLQPDAEKNHLFALPTPERTRLTHRKVAMAHGIKFPTNQSLAEPPLSLCDVVSKAEDDVEGGKEDGSGAVVEPMDTQEYEASVQPTRPDVIVHSSELRGKEQLKYQQGSFGIDSLLGGDQSSISRMELQRILGRWCNTTLFLSKAFHQLLTHFCGGDAALSVLLTETTGFHFRQMQFRQRMEKFKSAQTKDLVLTFTQMSREKRELFAQTMRQMNQQYTRRVQPLAAPSHSQADSSASTSGTPLASHKIKVSFKDEPGEGSGVARSFYVAVAEALLTLQQLPTTDGTPLNEEGTSPTGGEQSSSGDSVTPRGQISASARNFFSARNIKLRSGTRQSAPPVDGQSGHAPSAESHSEPISRIRTRSQRAAILVPGGDSSSTLATTHTTSSSRRSSSGSKSAKEDSAKMKTATSATSERNQDCRALFSKASKSGYYNIVPGTDSPFRLNVFRNIGRLIGICLQHLEILPLPLCRHIYKFILNRPITWFDIAFYDPSMFDSLRSIVYNEAEDSSHGRDFYESLQLTFAVDLSEEEGGGTVELKPGGDAIPVTKDNVLEYIYLFVENRLLGRHLKSLEAIRRGVFDVIPPESIGNLTSEDLRLLLCGSQEISIPLLQSYTKFSDESSAQPETLSKYKEWFWSVVGKFTPAEKQDLVFFWTGSPTLPSTEEGFQPLPTIMIRPADDHHLPTANTCISRLYVPLYSTKGVLRSKLLLAIKAKNFGFV